MAWTKQYEDLMRLIMQGAARMNRIEFWLLEQGWMKGEEGDWIRDAEAQEWKEEESTATPPSFAPTPDGTVPKPSEWFTAMHAAAGESLQDAPGWLREAIMDFSKSMPPHTTTSFLAHTPTSLTLKLTWPRPMPFGETVVGHSGDAGPSSVATQSDYHDLAVTLDGLRAQIAAMTEERG